MSQLKKMVRINKELLSYLLTNVSHDPLIDQEEFRGKEIVVEAEKRLYSVYIIKKGIAKCYLTEDTGKDFIQEFFGEGEIFGEVEMLNNEASFCTIEAITDLTVYKIPMKHFETLLEENRTMNLLVLKALASKIKYKALRHSYNQSHAIEDNLQRLQEQFPEFNKVISKKDVANYLGVTERSLNRIIRGLNSANQL